MAKVVFLIGTGRNGSKLLANVLKTGSNIKVFGEVEGSGPQSIWYKELYMGIGDRPGRMARFKDLRNKRIEECGKEIYLEKNHLLAPILDELPALWPDAYYIYLRRNSKQTLRSMLARGWYTKKDKGEYADGRLCPKDGIWSDSRTHFEKTSWLYWQYRAMCEDFVNDHNKNIIPAKYTQLTDPKFYKKLFEILKIEGYNEGKIKKAIKKKYGTSTDHEKYKFDEEQEKIHNQFKDIFALRNG